jgi:hypothetical protein
MGATLSAYKILNGVPLGRLSGDREFDLEFSRG